MCQCLLNICGPNDHILVSGQSVIYKSSSCYCANTGLWQKTVELNQLNVLMHTHKDSRV